MIRQAGPRYEGPIAMNADPDNLNKVGLIEAYQTVLDRGPVALHRLRASTTRARTPRC